ncbi:MAG: hypothetical protein JW855_03695 [Gammaproteobacteria bacterium]|nr:hypothetical protein [Gammaproteobacteria bacterium]
MKSEIFYKIKDRKSLILKILRCALNDKMVRSQQCHKNILKGKSGIVRKLSAFAPRASARQSSLVGLDGMGSLLDWLPSRSFPSKIRKIKTGAQVFRAPDFSSDQGARFFEQRSLHISK